MPRDQLYIIHCTLYIVSAARDETAGGGEVDGSFLLYSANKSLAVTTLWMMPECAPWFKPTGVISVCTTPREICVSSENTWARLRNVSS